MLSDLDVIALTFFSMSYSLGEDIQQKGIQLTDGIWPIRLMPESERSIMTFFSPRGI